MKPIEVSEDLKAYVKCLTVFSSFVLKLFFIGTTASTSELNVSFEFDLSTTTAAKLINNIYIDSKDSNGNAYIRVNQVHSLPLTNIQSSYRYSFGFDEGAFEAEAVTAVFLKGYEEDDIKQIW